MRGVRGEGRNGYSRQGVWCLLPVVLNAVPIHTQCSDHYLRGEASWLSLKLAPINHTHAHAHTHLQSREARQPERGAACLSTTATNTSASLRDACCCVSQRGSLWGFAVLVDGWSNPISMLSLRRKAHSCARAHTHKHTLKENAIAQLAQSLRCTPFVHNGI